MKLREIVLILGGMIVLLGFVAYMFDFYKKTSEIELIKRDMYFDSLILVQQQKLQLKDSLFEIRIDYIDSVQNEAIKKKLNKKEKAAFDIAIDSIKK